jgi:hypothetical protein
MTWQDESIPIGTINQPPLNWQAGSTEVLPDTIDSPEQAVTRAEEAIKVSAEHNISVDEGQQLIAGDEPSAFGKMLGQIKDLANEYVIKPQQVAPELERWGKFSKEAIRAEVAVGAEATSKLSLGALDVLTNKTTGDKTLADMVLRVSGMRELSPEERIKAETLGYLPAFIAPGMAVRKGLSYVPAAKWMKTLLGAGLTFGSTDAALQASRKLVTGQPIDWSEVHLQGGIGVLFGAGEVAVMAAMTGLAKGFEKYWGTKEIELSKMDLPRKTLEQQNLAQAVEKSRDIQRAKDSIKAGKGVPKDLMQKYVYGEKTEGAVKPIQQIIKEEGLSEPSIIGSQAEKELDSVISKSPETAKGLIYDLKNEVVSPTPIESIVNETIKAISSPVEAKTPETGVMAGVEPTGKEAGAPQIPKQVQRIEEAGVEPDLTKPQGLYTSPTGIESPHKDLGGKTTTYDVNPKANTLNVDATETSSGISALKQLDGDKELGVELRDNRGRITTDLTRQELVAKVSEKYPDVDWSKYYDQQEILEGYAGKLAREKGYDAIWGVDKQMPQFNEYVALTNKAVSSPSPQKQVAQPEKAVEGVKSASQTLTDRVSGEKQRMKGILYIPPATAGGKFAEKYPQADIEMVQKPKDIGPLQKWILTGTNQAYNTGNKDIIFAAEEMADTGIETGNEIAFTLQQDEQFYKSLPKEYLANKGEKFFDLMDKHFSPEEIDKTNLPPEVKNVLKHFKQTDEDIRQFIIVQKRNMAQAMLERKSLKELQELAESKGVEISKTGKKGDVDRAKIELAKDLSVFEVPDTWGKQWSHIWHAFMGQYNLKWVEEVVGDEGKSEFVEHFIGRAETQKEAYEKFADFLDMRKAQELSTDIKLVADPEFHIPYDVMRISRNQYYALQGQLKEAAEISSSEVADALKGVIGKKESKQKWWGALQQRKGAKGFSKDFWKVWTMYRIQYTRWKHLTDMNHIVEPYIESVKAQGLTGWAKWLEETKDYVWGRGRGESSIEFDRLLAKTPVIGDYVKPFALERYSGIARSINYWRQLQTVRFGVINSLQPLQTLYPVIGEKGMYRAVKLFFSKEGRDILEQHHVKLIGGKLAERGMKVSQNWMRYTPAGWSEKNNQALAFLGVYDKGRQMGMGDLEAARYARLRGQLFTQFIPSSSDTPKAFRGAFGSLIGQYRRFNIKQWELLSRLIRERNYSGVARFAAVRVLLGGMSDVLKIGEIAGGGYLTYKTYKYIEERYGRETADIVHHGLPALVGIDITGSIDMFNPPQGKGIPEQVGNLVLGPWGQTINQMYEAGDKKMAIELTSPQKTLNVLLNSSPSIKQFDSLFKAYEKDTTNYDTYQALKYDLEVEDMWKKALGFTPETETLQRMQINAMRDVYKEYDSVMDSIVTSMVSGDTDKAIRKVVEWNTMFPEAPLSSVAIEDRIRSKVIARNLYVTERQFLKLPAPIKKIFEGSGQVIKGD